jgi:hypothetical protein
MKKNNLKAYNLRIRNEKNKLFNRYYQITVYAKDWGDAMYELAKFQIAGRVKCKKITEV